MSVSVFTPTSGPGPGVFFSEYTKPCINRTGTTLTKGSLVELALDGSPTEITATDSASYVNNGGTTTVFANVVDPTTGGVRGEGVLGIVVEEGGIADNAQGDITFFGIVEEANVVNTSTLLTPKKPLVAKAGTANTLDAAMDTSAERVIALYLGPQSSSSTTVVIRKVLFDGVHGFTVNHA